MHLLDALLGTLCLAFLAVFASQTLGDAAHAERLVRTAALAEELASALDLHAPDAVEMPREGEPCLEVSLAALQAQGLLSLGFPETGPCGMRWQALICQPRRPLKHQEAGGTAQADPAAAEACAAEPGTGASQAKAAPLALACLVLPDGSTGAGGRDADMQDSQKSQPGQHSQAEALAFSRDLAQRLPGSVVLEGSALARGHGQHCSLDLAELGAHSLAASGAGLALVVHAGAAGETEAASAGCARAKASAFLQQKARPALPEGARMETALSLGGHSLAEASALHFVPLAQAALAELAGADAGAEAGAAPSAMTLLETACARPGSDGLLAFDAEQGLLLCSQGKPALVHDAGNTLAFAYIGFDAPGTGANGGALCPRGTSPEHFSLPAVFEAEDEDPAFVQLQSDLATRCGPSSYYGVADYFCGLEPQGRTLQIWQSLAKKRVWWDEEDEYQTLFGGFFGEAATPWSRARYDRELCQACRGGGFARRMVAGPAGQSPLRLHAYLGREDMMPASTVDGMPVSQGLVHFTLCRPRQL